MEQQVLVCPRQGTPWEGRSCWEDFFPGERLHRKVTGSVEDGTG